ncbi:MAG: Gldg family protein [bacterium]
MGKFANRILEILAIVLIGIILVYLLERNPVVFDWTKNKRYTLDKKIIDLLNRLEEDVYVKVLYDKGSQEYENISQTLVNLSRYSKKVKYEFLDPRRDIVKAQLYGFSSSNQVLIMYKNRKKFESTIDNEKFANVVSNLLRQKQGKILITTGHKEPSIDDYNPRGLSNLSKSLTDEGLNVETINLATNELYNPLALFIIAPKIDFSDYEISKVRKYLYEGGKVILAIKEYNKSKFPNITKLVSDFGIEISENSIIGLDPNNLSVVIGNPVNLPYLAALSNVNFYLITPLPINRAQNSNDSSLSEVLTAKGIMITKDMIKKGKVVLSKDLVKDYNVAIMSEKIFKDKKANLLVIGDYSMFMNLLLNAGENLNFILAIIDYFAGNETGFVFKPKDIPDVPILIPAGHQLLLYVFYLVLPFAFLLVTMFFVIKRRVRLIKDVSK